MPDVVIWYGFDLDGLWCGVEWDCPEAARPADERLADFLAAWMRQRSRCDREGG